MKKFIIDLFRSTAALCLVVYLLDGISAVNLFTIFTAAVLFDFVNQLLKPLLMIVTLPITILTLGISTFFINALIFLLISKIIPGFAVNGYWAAFWGALLYSIFKLLLGFIFNVKGRVYINTQRPQPPRNQYENVVDAEVVEKQKDYPKLN